MYKYIFIGILLVLYTSRVEAQGEIFGSFPELYNAGSFTKQIIASNDSYYSIVMYYNDDELEPFLIQTDYFLNIQREISLRSIDNLNIVDIYYGTITESELILVARSKAIQHHQLITVSIQLDDLTNISLIDDYSLPANSEGVEFFQFNLDKLTNNFYSTGSVEINSEYAFLYIEIDKFGEFVKGIFDSSFMSQEIIVSSAWNNNNMLFSTFGNYSTYLANNQAGIVNVLENRLPYVYNDTSHYSLYLNENCFDYKDGFQCVSRTIGTEPFAGLINYYKVIDDSISLDTFVSVTPLYKKLGVVKASIEEEEIIICANGYLNFFENDESNEIYFSKLERQFPNNEICSTVFDSGEGLVIIDFEIDHEKNIVIVGFKKNETYENGRENFYLKISKNCEVLSSSIDIVKDDLLQVNPNPASDFIFITKLSDYLIGRIDVYAINGVLCKSIDYNNLDDNRIDLSELVSGIYIVTFTDKNDNTIRRKVSIVD